MIASLIGLGFGWLWLLVGASAAGRSGTAILIAGSALIALAAWRVVRCGRVGDRRFDRKYYIAAVVLEIVAIMLAQAWLSARGESALLFPVVGIIVGLHFIGLWLAMRSSRFLWLSGALVAINLVALLVPLSPSQRVMLSGFGSAASLVAAVSA